MTTGMGGALRHLPVYLLLDCSGSMIGDPIVAVNEGLGIIYSSLMRDPQAVETVKISVIRFADAAEQEDLVSLPDFIPPALTAAGRTALGSAIHVLVESIQNDLTHDKVAGEVVTKGDFRPLVFLLTDGRPTDSWRGEVDKLKALRGNQKPTMVALGCGNEADGAMLREITENVFLMKDTDAEQIKAFFKWISGSIAKTSHDVGGGAETGSMASPIGRVSGVIKYGE